MTDENMKIAEEFCKRHFFAGTTCSHEGRRSVVWVRGRWALMKKKGHTEYINRFSGSSWCETVYSLVDLMSKPQRTNSSFSKGVKDWEGRWTKEKQVELDNFIASYEGSKIQEHDLISPFDKIIIHEGNV